MQDPPSRLFGLIVVGQCPKCNGDGVLWGYDGETFWADQRCPECNCVGLILDLPDFWKKNPSQQNDGETDHDDIPF